MVANVMVSSTPARTVVAAASVAKKSRAGQRIVWSKTSRTTTTKTRITKTGPIEGASPNASPTVAAAAPTESTRTGRPIGHLAAPDRPRAMKAASPITARSAAASASSING